jgi:hypothetical protein
MTNSEVEAIHVRDEVIADFIPPERHRFVNELVSTLECLPEIRDILVRLQNGPMDKYPYGCSMI